VIQSADERDPLDELAEEFLGRFRAGERPAMGEFLARAPGRADELRELLSALVMVEGLKPAGDETLGLQGGSVGPAYGSGPERLGDYRIIREIGRGGMGVVYEAEQLSLGRRVALKVVSSGLARTPHQIRRFLREARSAAQLHHTNIVPVFGVGDQDGHYYYAMQYISGLGLDKVLEEVKRLKSRAADGANGGVSSTQPGLMGPALTSVTRSLLSGSFEPPPAALVNGLASQTASIVLPGESSLAEATDSDIRYARSVARIGVQAAEALEYAHQQGTLHRDIKPSNLLLDTQGTVWVADFGLAKAAEDDDLTQTGDLIGTLRYMAPERFRGSCDARSDVHALGLTLYELLALRPAFDAPDRARLVQEITQREPPRLKAVNPAVPRDLEMVVHKAIECEPSDRYATAGAMAEDLRCFLEDRPIEARRVGSTERLTRWARKNPGLATLGTAVAVMLAVTVIVIAAANVKLRQEHETTLSHLARAENAEADAVAKLLESALARSRAGRRSGLAGRRFEGLAALRDAVRFDIQGRRRPEFRDEAIACLALADLRPVYTWAGRAADGFVGVDFDPISRLMARGGPRGEVWLQHVDGGGKPFRLPGTGPRVALLRFGPDGRFLAAKLDEGGRVELVAWDVVRRAEVLRIPGGVHAAALEILPDGRTLAAGRRDGSIVFHDLTTGAELRRLSPGTVPQSLRFDPSGRRVAVVSPNSDEPVQVRDLADGTLLAGWSAPEGAMSLDWSAGGRLLAVGGPDGRIHLLDPDDDSRPPRMLRGHDGAILSLAFHPGGRLLASSSWDGTLRLWDTGTMREVEKAPLPDARMVRFSRDGRFLGPGHDGVSSWLWELADGLECRSLVGVDGAGGRIRSVDYLRGSGVMVSAGERGVRLDLPHSEHTSTPAFIPLPGTTGAAPAPDGSFLLTGGAAGLLRWPVARPSDGSLRVGPPEPLGVLDGLPTGQFRLGLDGRTLAVVTDEERGRVVVLDLDEPGGPRVELVGHPNLERVDISPDGRWVATGTWRGTGVKIWDVARGVVSRELPVAGSADVTFSPDGRLLVTSSGTEYEVWDTRSWTLLHRFPRSQTGGLPGKAAFRPDGRLLALLETRTLVRLVDPATGRGLAHLEPPEPQPIVSMGFSPEGQLLTLTFDSDSIQVWDLAALRRGLAGLDLDWDAPGDPEPVPATSPTEIVVVPAPWLAPLAESERLARAGRLEDASSSLETAIDLGARGVNTWARRALFRKATGDEAGYREACRQLLATVEGAVPSPKTANTVAWSCALGPSSIEDYTRAIELAGHAVSGHPEIDRLNTLGAVLYRAGRFEEAIRQLERSISAHGAGGTPYDALFLAMAHHRVGHSSTAKDWLRRAAGPAPVAQRKPGSVGPSSWVPHIEVELLLREAQALIGPPDP
jgi:serine/threonine protein kinase/WD40 repeat protein